MSDLNFTDFMSEVVKPAKTIEMPDGTSIEVPAIESLSDEFFAAAKADDNIAMARAVVGNENYEKWKSFGGTAVQLMMAFAKLNGVALPNSLTP